MVTDDRGNEVGIALADPENSKLRVFAVPADGFTKIDGALLGWRVERALAWRTQLGLPGHDHAYHLIHGGADGLPGFTVDVMGRVAIVYAYADGLRPLAKTLAEADAVGKSTMVMSGNHFVREGELWRMENLELTPCDCDLNSPSWAPASRSPTVR